MSYFVFKYQDNKFRSVEHIDTFESYKEARTLLKKLRKEKSPNNPDAYKLVYAEDMLEAEMLILEKRDAPILREWEK
ncbi:MAG: hypothetical protein CMQ81_04680 [Gammaproteobacteria bacterium]|jgi:hypothetical protein|nr:hypothetical protein [Gammaproteobacteria bacterium]|tara:strand:- start:317 stop:547 length:231 start_codon:yes stop_codon:yes gene_type:complete